MLRRTAREHSYHLPPCEDALLDRVLASQQTRADHSGARLVPDGTDALALRVATTRSAERSIDVQSYIWHSDRTGRALAVELLRAADRGVRVRVLLDDMDARSRDAVLVALDRHPQIEIRLFNPFVTRSGMLRTALEVFARGSRLNRRMHNKAWIVDGRLAIVGGRNVGDEYFAASEEVNFVDLDVLLAGPAVEQAARSFDAYWNNECSVPIWRLRRMAGIRYRLSALRKLLDAPAMAPGDALEAALASLPSLESMLSGDLSLDWSSDATVVADDPRKANRGQAGLAPGVLESMMEAIDSAQAELLLISPYFVPGAAGTARLRELVRHGARVAVLTNSLAATDVAAVHSGYSRYRSALLQHGVQLHELKAAIVPDEHGRRMRLGSSRASLHTKAAIVDRQRVFIGSFNLDPRSADLNCELGAWIRSESLVRELLGLFEAAAMPQNSFSLTLDARGALRWCEQVSGKILEHDSDPYAAWGRRAVTRLLQLLPIESQL